MPAFGASGDLLEGAGSVLTAAGNAASNFAQASAYGNNAEIDKIQAGMSTMMTRVNAARQEQHAYQVAGAQTAAIGASGLNVSGSALDVLHQTARDASLDKSLINYKGGIEGLNWQLKYKSDKKAQKASTIGGIINVIEGGAALALLS